MQRKLLASLLFVALSGLSFAAKPLLVCTAGDYPPLTYQNPASKQFSGFAISVASVLAKKLNRPLQFVATPWPDLNRYLESGRCDIAMGGITKTAARSQLFYSSIAVLKGRKAAIFSSSNAGNFTSFKSINRSGVTVLENAGGTNDAYAKQVITQAKVKTLQQNAAVFACLQQKPKQALVMLTDNIEVAFRAKQSKGALSNHGLDIKLPHNPMTEKVYLLPKTPAGKALKGEVDALIKQLHSSHKLFSLYQKALSSNYHLAKLKCPL